MLLTCNRLHCWYLHSLLEGMYRKIPIYSTIYTFKCMPTLLFFIPPPPPSLIVPSIPENKHFLLHLIYRDLTSGFSPEASIMMAVPTSPAAQQLPLSSFSLFPLSRRLALLEWSHCSLSRTRRHLSHSPCTSPLSPRCSVELTS